MSSEKDQEQKQGADDGDFRCGRIAVIGRTNAGKSTLLNQLVGEKVAIASRMPQTTRHAIIGVRNEPGAQLIFVDTPGVHAPKYQLNRRMLDAMRGALMAIDGVILVIDGSERQGKGDAVATQLAVDAGVPFVVALNKTDQIKPKSALLPMMEKLSDCGARAVVPLCALRGEAIDGLLAELRELLPAAPPVYPTDLTTDQSERFFIAELIREKVLNATRQEVPHATAVFIESIEERKREKKADLLVVTAVLAVEKDNQKGILIGRAGSMLKSIGTAAREDIEAQLNIKCHLELFVKVQKRWRDDDRILGEVLAEPTAGVPELGS